jgi:hypothetical protein
VDVVAVLNPAFAFALARLGSPWVRIGIPSRVDLRV